MLLYLSSVSAAAIFFGGTVTLHWEGGGRVLKKVVYGEAPPRGPTPYPFI